MSEAKTEIENTLNNNELYTELKDRAEALNRPVSRKNPWVPSLPHAVQRRKLVLNALRRSENRMQDWFEVLYRKHGTSQ